MALSIHHPILFCFFLSLRSLGISEGAVRGLLRIKRVLLETYRLKTVRQSEKRCLTWHWHHARPVDERRATAGLGWKGWLGAGLNAGSDPQLCSGCADRKPPTQSAQIWPRSWGGGRLMYNTFWVPGVCFRSRVVNKTDPLLLTITAKPNLLSGRGKVHWSHGENMCRPQRCNRKRCFPETSLNIYRTMY